MRCLAGRAYVII